MIWLLVFSIYAAPANAVDWNGPWALGDSKVIGQGFKSEAECRNSAVQFIGRMQQGMLAPMRFKCVAVAAGLPVNAPR